MSPMCPDEDIEAIMRNVSTYSRTKEFFIEMVGTDKGMELMLNSGFTGKTGAERLWELAQDAELIERTNSPQERKRRYMEFLRDGKVAQAKKEVGNE